MYKLYYVIIFFFQIAFHSSYVNDLVKPILYIKLSFFLNKS